MLKSAALAFTNTWLPQSAEGRRECERFDQHTSLSRRIAPESCKQRHESFASKISEGRRSADRRIVQLCPRHARRRYRLKALRARSRATQTNVTVCLRFGRARLSALRERYLPRKLMPRLSPGRASREREGAGVTRTIERAYSDAPRAPVIVPAGRCPSRPGAGLQAPPAGTALAPSFGCRRRRPFDERDSMAIR